MSLTLKQESEEHASWTSDCEGWKDDLRQWKSEHEMAMGDLRRVADLMKYRSRSLDLHRIAVEALQTKMQMHRNAARLYEGGVECGPAMRELETELCTEHGHVGAEHQLQAEVHEKLRQLHCRMLEDIQELLRLLEPIEGIVRSTARVGAAAS